MVGRVCEINQYKLTITELRSYNATESVFDRGVASGSSPWACYTALIDFQSAAPRGCITARVTDNAHGLLGRNPDESSALPTVSPTPSPSPCSECCGAGATYYVTDDDSGTYPSRAADRRQNGQKRSKTHPSSCRPTLHRIMRALWSVKCRHNASVALRTCLHATAQS